MHTPNPSACLTHSNPYLHNSKIRTHIKKLHLSTLYTLPHNKIRQLQKTTPLLYNSIL